MAGRREVELAMQGDHDAFAALAAASAGRLFALARMILRDMAQAEDATQDALVRAWRDLPHLRDPDRFDAWLRRLLVNACYDEARRAGRRRDAVEMLPLPDETGGDPAAPLADRDLIDRALGRLPVEQRAVLVLHHHLGMTQAEVADTLGIPVGTVKSRLRYGLDAMRAAIDADERVSDVLADRGSA